MYILKFVLRSWWRNKLFVTISLVSLVIGIACTNLLTAFVLYEYNIEYNNPNRDRILHTQIAVGTPVDWVLFLFLLQIILASSCVAVNMLL